MSNIDTTNEPTATELLVQKAAKKKEKKKQKKEFERWLAEKEVQAQANTAENGLYWTRGEPRKALSTFLRNQNKMITTSLGLADRKAMIMIRINSLILSGAMLFYRYIDETIEMGWLIGAILIIGAGVSLILAVMAARPSFRQLRHIYHRDIEPKYPMPEENIFMPFYPIELDEFEEGMDKVVNSQELQLGNQLRFAFAMEKYLGVKYLFLDIAYTVFLVSMVIMLVVFAVSNCFVSHG